MLASPYLCYVHSKFVPMRRFSKSKKKAMSFGNGRASRILQFVQDYHTMFVHLQEVEPKHCAKPLSPSSVALA